MLISEAHRQALAAMEAEDFVRAEEILAPLLSSSAANWLVKNDLALYRFMNGDAADADALLGEILASEPGNSFALINRFYVRAAEEVRRLPPAIPRTRIISMKGEGPEAPRFSVVMPTYNRPDSIEESIASVRAQTFPDWELIIVNDGGSRKVEAVVDQWLPDRRLRYIYAEHGGLSAARNVGMAVARGEWITQLDDDDIYYPDHLATVARAVEDNPSCRVFYTDFYRAYQERQAGQWVTRRRVLDYSHDFSRELLRRGTIAPVCNLTHHREALETVGYYHEAILRAMDWEYFIRLAKRYDFLHIPKVTGEFRQRSDRSQMTRSFDLPRNYYRNLVSFLHGFFPLTGARFLGSESGGKRLKRALDRLVAEDEDEFYLRRLELRKLLAEPSYALFYTLSKRLAEEGFPGQARRVSLLAAQLRPWEIKAWVRVLRPQ